MEFKRDRYLKQLIELQWNGLIKVITGIRRCGKSYLLGRLFRQYLLTQGVRNEQIISIELDLARDIRFRDPLELARSVRERVENSNQRFYLFVDEVQMSDEVPNPHNPQGNRITFYDALNDLRRLENLDVYVTGSNSRMLSSDILTEFRGRSDEIRVHPLSFGEIYAALGGDKEELFEQYAFYGGLPLVQSRPNDEARMRYLSSLFDEVYLKDILERGRVANTEAVSQIVDLLCSSVGSLTNPSRIANSLKSLGNGVSPATAASYIRALTDAFLFSQAKRYDVRGKKYFEYPYKYYCEDVGLRNARLGFRQMEMTHIMENIVYNELIARGWAVDVGVVSSSLKDAAGKSSHVAREIDFVAVKGGRRVYVQSAFAIPDAEKMAQEVKPFSLTGDSFPKVIVRRDIRKRWYDDAGVLNIGLIDFLLDDSAL